MTEILKDPSTPQGPVATEIEARLQAALNPERLAVIDDSEKHRGHAGHDGSGESHFTVEIVSDRFTGQNRVARQRLVNAALADLLREKVHALAIKARAPGE
ncbi:MULTISPECIES: BolA family protein [unclassified Sphingobium]|jgi:BolA protein|uniref:BolA family protein n=1 Tax=unclassified Sphingobium TaxID=2611147 RepID=UPI00105D92F6